MSLWAILAAPLLAGNDIRSMTPETKAILLNHEVIAVDQDRGGKQGRRMWQSGDVEIWVRELSGGAKAVGVFNRGTEQKDVTVRWTDIGITKKVTRVRDLWAKQDIRVDGPDYGVTVPGHGVVFLRIGK